MQYLAHSSSEKMFEISTRYFFMTLLLSVLIPTTCFSQSGGGVDTLGTGGRHTISGRIYFPSGRRSDVRVKVKLQSLQSGELTVFSDVNGTFSFKGLEAGSYTVVVDAGDEYEQAHESVYIDTEAGNSRRGVILPPVSRLYTVDITLRLKMGGHAKPGVVSASLAAVPEEGERPLSEGCGFSPGGRQRQSGVAIESSAEYIPRLPTRFE
jgi:hypothetical protein